LAEERNANVPCTRAQAAAEAARDAERREREWLGQHRGGAGGIAAREAAERLEGERALRAGQDEEFKVSLLADAARDAQRRAADAARRQAVELRAALRATLPPEPPAGAGAVRVRVRLPGGGVAERRWAADAGVGAVEDWVQVSAATGHGKGSWARPCCFNEPRSQRPTHACSPRV
jgi:hypothetical protein